jgi:hypothetical protein
MMADDQNTSTAVEDEQQQKEDKPKQPKTFGRRASTNLREARRSFEEAGSQPDERARHLVAEANVLALLDLADAIRSSKEAP